MNRSWFPEMLMFGWLSTGYAAIHILTSFIAFGILQGIFAEPHVQDNVVLSKKGEPYISRYDVYLSKYIYSPADGSSFVDQPGFAKELASGISISSFVDSQGVTWSDRICGLNDYQTPGVYWYFVAPPGHGGAGYFTGYDELSKRHIGYLDREGFSRDKPSIEKSFPVRVYTSPYGGLQGTLAGPQLDAALGNYSRAMIHNTGNRSVAGVPGIPSGIVYLRSNQDIFEVNLASRTVKPLLTIRPEVEYLTGAYFMIEKEDEPQPESGLLKGYWLLLLTESGLTLHSPISGEEQTISIESGLIRDHEGNANFRFFARERALVTEKLPQGIAEWKDATILWFDAQGHVERRKDLKLHYLKQDLFSNFDLGMSLAVPVPMVSLGAIFVAPLVAPSAFSNKESYGGRVFDQWQYFRLFLSTTVLLGLIVGWSCRQRERDVFGNSSWSWPVLVGLCGWFGWMGYVCLRPLPARQADGRWMPSTPESAPPLRTEIFA